MYEKKSNTSGIMLADGLCLLVAIIWGTGFIASQIAIEANISAAVIMMLRFCLAAIVMFIVCIPRLKRIDLSVIKAGMYPGIFLFAGFYTQILGQQRTSVSHCAFLTATNVVMIPFLVWIISRKRPAIRTFVVSLMTFAGIAVLSIKLGSMEFYFNMGDALSLLCALMFALQIASLEKVDSNADAMLINMVQMATAAIFSVMAYFITDAGAISRIQINAGFIAVLYLGLISTCLCFFMQTYAQKYTTASQAGVLLSTEGLFGSIFSVLLGMEAFTVNMAVGGAIILISVILMEILSDGK